MCQLQLQNEKDAQKRVLTWTRTAQSYALIDGINGDIHDNDLSWMSPILWMLWSVPHAAKRGTGHYTRWRGFFHSALMVRSSMLWSSRGKRKLAAYPMTKHAVMPQKV